MSIIFNHYRILKELESKLDSNELADKTDMRDKKGRDSRPWWSWARVRFNKSVAMVSWIDQKPMR